MLRRAASSLVLCLLGPTPAFPQFKVLETKDLRLVYIEGQGSFLAPYVGRAFENSLQFHRRLFDYEPREKVTVLLTDFGDYGNAGATAVPRDFVGVEIAPLSFAFETLASNERMNTIMNHELAHVANMDQAAGRDLFFRGLFGGKVAPIAAQPESILYLYLTAPRIASPRWYLEGAAVFVDTWMAGGRGRAQGPWDEMVFRSMVKDGSRFYDPLGLVSEGTKIDFQLQINSYLYGTRFMSYLALQHGPEKVVEWTGRRPGSRAYYSSQFKDVFGVSLEQAWSDWTVWERGFQQANLEKIRLYPTTSFRDLSPRPLGSVSRAYVSRDGKKLYAAFNYPGIAAHVGAISLADGSVAKIADVKGPSIYTVTSIAYDPESDTLFYTRDNDAYRDIVALDPRKGTARLLMKDARIGELVFDHADRSLWGIRHYNGICTLVRIPHPYKEWKRVHSWPYGEVVYDLDLSRDGTLVSASVGEISGRNTLRVMKTESLLAGEATAIAEQEFAGAIPSNFVFSDDGRFLYGSSFYSGVSNLFRFELATNALEAVTNTETGFFRPVPQGGDEVIAFRFTGAGFVPAALEARPVQDVSAITLLGAEIAEKQPVVKEWNVGSPAKIPFDSMIERAGPFHSGRSLKKESFYPIVTGYKDSVAGGLRLNLSDPIQLSRANLTVSYSPSSALESSERLHAMAEFQHLGLSARASYNPTDFYDLFGPTKTSRKGYNFALGHDKTLVYDLPRQLDLGTQVSYWGGLQTLPGNQNVPVAVGTLLSARARLHYRNIRSSLGHVDDEKGYEWDVAVEGDFVQGRGYLRVYGDYDRGWGLPLRHSSLWWRNSSGFSPEDPSQPYSNFYFGGFGNNWVDRGPEQRYRAQSSFPGPQIDEIAGANYVKSMLEWNLPPLRFRRVGSPGFYLTWARPAIFATGLATNIDRSAARRTVGNVGAQIDLRFTVLSALDMTLSGGYAIAFEDGRAPWHEAMVSLKVLK